MSSSQSIPDSEEDEDVILDPPVQSPQNRIPSQHHLAPDQWSVQHHTPLPQRDPACASAGRAPSPASESNTGPSYEHQSLLQLTRLTDYPAEQDTMRYRRLAGQVKALKFISREIRSRPQRRTPSPPMSKRRRLEVSPNSPSSDSCHDPIQGLLAAKALSRAAIIAPDHAPGPTSKSPKFAPKSLGQPPDETCDDDLIKQESLATRDGSNSTPSSPEDKSGNRDLEKAVEPIPDSSAPQSPSPATADETKVPSPELPPPVTIEPELCPEQAALVELICSGRNVFYTGSAGCGKSTVLKAFTKRLKDMGKKVYVLAPTGRAALQVNGTTTWTYAGWTPNFHKKTLKELKERAHGKFVWKRFDKTDVIVIDEISMVENLHFERINKIMQEALHDPTLPVQKAFGGVQVVVTGDFCQLPPVKPFRQCMECGSDTIESYYQGEPSYRCPDTRHPVWRDEQKWAFASDAWNQCDFAHVNLKKIHRQSDLKFIRILNKCRIGEALTESDKRLLMDHPSSVHHATKLFATRKEVAKVNEEQFEKLKTLKYTYWARDTFKWRITLHPHLSDKAKRKAVGPKDHKPLSALEEHRFEECVELKKGMLVVLLTNLSLDQGLCNGSQGIVCGFKEYEKDKLPTAYGEYAITEQSEVKSHIEGAGAEYKMWPVVRFHNGITRVIHSKCSINELGDDKPYSLLSRTQIPLAPAWAMTIHKSQGLTLDRVIADLSETFEVGQVYVALSRATGLEGLRIDGGIKGLEKGQGGNKTVQRFLRHHFGPLNG